MDIRAWLWGWAWRLLGPLAVWELFRRLSWAHARAPPHDARLRPAVAALLVGPGDVLLCKGGSADSCTIAAWSRSPWTHIALVGPDRRVYDMTPGEHERSMGLVEYVRAYEGWVCWAQRPAPAVWHDPGARTFREEPGALLLAAVAPSARWGPLARRVCAAAIARRDADTRASFCSEYVARVLGLPDPSMTHPADFAPGGRYGADGPVVLLYEE